MSNHHTNGVRDANFESFERAYTKQFIMRPPSFCVAQRRVLSSLVRDHSDSIRGTASHATTFDAFPTWKCNCNIQSICFDHVERARFPLTSQTLTATLVAGSDLEPICKHLQRLEKLGESLRTCPLLHSAFHKSYKCTTMY